MNRKIFVLRLAVLIAMLLSLTGLPGIPVQAAELPAPLLAPEAVSW